MDDIRLSVIIPAYNCELWIGKCLDSLLNQTFKNFEVIVVNDGSTDKTERVVSEYSDLIHKLRCIYQENKGQAVARNVGIELAEGQYIMFIDADDYVESDYVEKYLKAIEGSGHDAVIGGYEYVEANGKRTQNLPHEGLMSWYMMNAPWAKIYTRDFLMKNSIRFEKIRKHEDMIFNIRVLECGAKIGHIKYAGYKYVKNNSSITNNDYCAYKDSDAIKSVLDAINVRVPEDVELHEYFLVRFVVWYLMFARTGAKPAEFMAEYEKKMKWLKEFRPSFLSNKYLRPFGPAGEKKSVWMIVACFMLFHKCHLMKVLAALVCR